MDIHDWFYETMLSSYGIFASFTNIANILKNAQ